MTLNLSLLFEISDVRLVVIVHFINFNKKTLKLSNKTLENYIKYFDWLKEILFDILFHLGRTKLFLRDKNDYDVCVYLNYTVMNDFDQRTLEEKI